MKIVCGVNKIAEDLYFIAHPMGKIYTGVVVLIGERVALVDSAMPPAAAEHIFPLLRSLRKNVKDIDIVVNTHWHGDHVGSNKQIRQNSRATIAVHVKDRPCLESVDAQRKEFYERFPAYFPPPILNPENACRVDLSLRAGDRLKLGSRPFEVIHLPGHTPGSMGLYDRKDRLLLAGDAIQGQGIEGHIAMVGDVEQYLQTLDEVARLPVDLAIMGHAFAPCKSAVLEGEDFYKFLDLSRKTVQEYMGALSDRIQGNQGMMLVEATDCLCTRFGTRSRSLMAMCTAYSILQRLGIEVETEA